MKKRFSHILLTLLLPLLSMMPAAAFNADKLQFNRLSVEDGLPNDYVHKICRDAKGYLWFATSYGLCRYDGSRMRAFFKEEMQLNSNFVANILIDRHENLWICTDSGVSVYNDHMQSFTNLNELAGTDIRNEVTAIEEDSRGVVWIGVNEQGVYVVDPATWTVGRRFIEDGVQTMPANVSAFFIDKDNDVSIIGLYNNDLYIADGNMSSPELFRTSDGRAPFKGRSIKCIIPGNAGEYYVSYSSKSICRINPFTMAFEDLDVPIEGKVRLKKIRFVDRDLMAITSNNGIWFYDVRSGSLQNTSYSETDRWTIPGNNILFVGGDLKDGLLVGTHADGVALQMTSDAGFERIDRYGDISLIGSRVSGFAEDGKGHVYVATEQAGLLEYSERDNSLRRLPYSSPLQSLSGVWVDGDDLWLISSVGLTRVNLVNGREKKYLQDKVDNYTLYRTADGRLLLGTTLGLKCLDEDKDEFVQLPELKGSYICDILQDSRGRMWYATYADGIFIMDGDGNTTRLTKDNSDLPTDRVLTLYPDSRGNIWARTYNEGLLRIDDESMALYTSEDGLSGNIIYDMVEDALGNMWVTSDKGLTMIGNVDEMVHFTLADGLLNAGFTAHSAFVTSSGALLMGSRDGFVRFEPRAWVKDATVPNVEICEFRIAQETVRPTDEGSVLDCCIADTRSLVLSPRQNSFGFVFSLIDRSMSGVGEIFYMLEGYDDSWRNAGLDRRASYVKVPPGHYRLLVKGVSGKGIWNTSVPPLEITVRPSFFQTPFARMLYVLLVALPFGIAALVYRRVTDRKRHEREIQMKIDLNNEKVNFFMTMAHEIKTPLTLIRTPLDSIMSRGVTDAETMEDLSIIDRNTGYLTQLVGELLDFTRLEQKGYTLSCTSLNIKEEIDFILDNYRNALDRKQLELRRSVCDGDVTVWADKAGLAKIVNNLLSNALKHAVSYVSVSISRDGDNAVVEVANDGAVIPADMRKRIFESFVQYRGGDGAENEGFGIGLSVAATLASLHGGAIEMDDDLSRNNFILTMPLYMAAQAEDQPLEEPNDASRSTVLITEDNDQLREYICRKLSSRYNVLAAADGVEAMGIIARTCRIDMVVTDISMPRMDGLELCRRIKDDFTYSHIMVVILSANLTPQLKITSMDSGADLIIEKPFSFDYLVSSMESLIRNRRILMDNVRKAEDVLGNGEADGDAPMPGISSRDELFLRTLNKCVEDNLSDPDFSLEMLTSMMKTSKSTLNRKVKDLLGTSPNDYIRDRRLVKAAELLSTSTDRVSEICWAVGFSTPSYFIKCFRKKYGMSPTEYVKRG